MSHRGLRRVRRRSRRLVRRWLLMRERRGKPCQRCAMRKNNITRGNCVPPSGLAVIAAVRLDAGAIGIDEVQLRRRAGAERESGFKKDPAIEKNVVGNRVAGKKLRGWIVSRRVDRQDRVLLAYLCPLPRDESRGSLARIYKTPVRKIKGRMTSPSPAMTLRRERSLRAISQICQGSFCVCLPAKSTRSPSKDTCASADAKKPETSGSAFPS